MADVAGDEHSRSNVMKRHLLIKGTEQKRAWRRLSFASELCGLHKLVNAEIVCSRVALQSSLDSGTPARVCRRSGTNCQSLQIHTYSSRPSVFAHSSLREWFTNPGVFHVRCDEVLAVGAHSACPDHIRLRAAVFQRCFGPRSRQRFDGSKLDEVLWIC